VIRALTVAELLALPAAVDLPTAGRAWGLGRTKSHELARAGEFPCPVLRLGNAYRVTRSDLLTSLGIDPDSLYSTTTAPVTAGAGGPERQADDAGVRSQRIAAA
jgi:hypothetical protein